MIKDGPPVFMGECKELKRKDENIHSIYLKWKDTKTPEKQRELMAKIDEHLDERLRLRPLETNLK
jgi:hypothetical protein